MNLEKIWYYLTDKGAHYKALTLMGFNNHLSDEEFVKRMFKARLGYELDLDNPKTFNEKLQWLKLHDRKDIYTQMVDKYEVKKYVSDMVGEQYVVPLLGVWEKFEDIDFSQLPEQFVLKCTHDCGGLVICRDKKELDIKAAGKKIQRSLKRQYYLLGREWPYKNVKPRIIAEEYMKNAQRDSTNESNTSKNLIVYKVMTFSGKAKIIQAIQDDKTKDESIDYFDTGWNFLDINQGFPNSKIKLPRPKKLDEIIMLAEKMSHNLPFLRVDFYEVDEGIKFSEFTFYSDNGTAKFNQAKWDKQLGEWIVLPENDQ